MQTITVKVLPKTLTKPTRVKATHAGQRRTITESVKSEEAVQQTQIQVAQELKDDLGWTGVMVGGTNRDNSMTFVFTTEQARLK